MPLIDIFFTLIHYILYAFIGVICYRRFILPTLVSEQQTEQAHHAQTRDSLEKARQGYEATQQHIAYVRTRLNALQHFQQASFKAYEQEHYEYEKKIDEHMHNLHERQEKVAQMRRKHALYDTIAPEVFAKLQKELAKEYKDNRAFLDHALITLKAHDESSRRNSH